MIGMILRWGLAGAIAGALLGGADALVMYTGASHMFFDQAEMGRTCLIALGMCSGAGAAIGLLLGVLLESIAHLSTSGRPLHGKWRVEVIAALPLAGALDFALWHLTAGPQASQLPGRAIIVALVSIVGAAGMAMVGARVARARKGHVRLVLALGLIGLSAAAYLADLKILVRLYPVFHSTLSLLALALFTAALPLVWRNRSGKIITGATALVTVAAMVLGGMGLHKSRTTQNPRFVISDRTPTASDVLMVARVLVPPPRSSLIDEIPLVDDDENTAETDQLSLPGKSVVLITVDAMRFDRVAYEDDNVRKPAPAMEALAAKSVVFERAYTPIPHTSYAVASLLTGKYISPLFDVPGAPEVHETWPQIMKRFRYETGAFFTKAVFFIDRPRFEPYLRMGYGFNHVTMDYEVPAEERAQQTIDFLSEHAGGDRPLFTWTHFFEPHEPYDPSCTEFGDDNESRYDCEIATVDRAVKRLLEHVERELPNSIIVLTADHGEEFGEHGGRYHGTTLYDEQIRVPLLIRVPEVKPTRVEQPVNLVDVMGTVLSILDIPIPARVRSRDLTPLLLGDGKATTTAFCEVHEQVMAVHGNHKLYWDRERDVSNLYDLEADPDETRSVAGVNPDLVKNLKGRVLAWERDHTRVELRPVKTESDDRSWPAEVRRVLEGDEDAVDKLPGIITPETPLVVRLKAASLVASLWRDRPAAPLAAVHDDDPRVAAWLALAAHRASDAGALSRLREIQPDLKSGEDPWRSAVLARMAAGETGVSKDVIDIVDSAEAPLEQRLEGIELIRLHKVRSARDMLVSHINDYQLALAVARALAAIGDRSAVPILIKRLKRERFPERRSAVCSCLVPFDDRRTVAPIAGELARVEPASEALASLVQMGIPGKKGRRIEAPAEEAVIFIVPGAIGSETRPNVSNPRRVAVLMEAHGDGGTVEVMCNGTVAARLPVFDGSHTGIAELQGCSLPSGDPMGITLRLEPADLSVKIAAYAVVGE